MSFISFILVAEVAEVAVQPRVRVNAIEMNTYNILALRHFEWVNRK